MLPLIDGERRLSLERGMAPQDCAVAPFLLTRPVLVGSDQEMHRERKPVSFAILDKGVFCLKVNKMSYLTEEEQKEHDKEQRRRVSRQQIIEHAKKSLLFTAFDVKWVPVSASLVAVGHYPDMKGAISIFEMNQGELTVKQELKKPTPFKCCTFGQAPTEARRMATGDFTGGIHIWDLDHSTDPVVEMKNAHDSIINSVDGALYNGPPEIVSGSRDGAVKVWDARQPSKPVVCLAPVDKEKARDCWTVRFGNSYTEDDRMVVAGYDNGDVKLFDLKTQKMVHEFNVSNGVCDLEFDRPDIEANKLIVSSLEGRVRVYDVRTLHPELGYAYVEDRVSTGTVWCSKALPQNREIFISGGAGELTLSKYNYPPDRALQHADNKMKGVAGSIEELNKVKVGDQPISAIDWHRHREGLLCCCGFDQTVRVMVVTKLSAV